MSRHKKNEPKSIENRKARHQYSIEDTLEVGIVLTGSEVKSVRDGQVSLAEGWIRASISPLHITLHGVHIAEYQNASPAHQHKPQRPRVLLAHKREIRKLGQSFWFVIPCLGERETRRIVDFMFLR